LSGAVLTLASAIGLDQASADTITVTVTGTTTYDPAGQFGSLGSDITVTYTFDTSLGVLTGDNSTTTTLYGGTVHGVTSPSLGAVVTTDALTIKFGGAYNATLSAFNDGTNSSSFQSAEDSETSYVSADMQPNAVVGAVLPESIFTPFSYSCQDTVIGSSIYHDTCVGNGYYNGSPFTFHEADVTLSNPSAVPAPIVGAGLPGMMSVLAGGGFLWWRRRWKTSA